MKVSNRFGAIKDLTYCLFRHLLAHPELAVENDNECKNTTWNDPIVQMSVKRLKGYIGEQETINNFSRIFNHVAGMVAGEKPVENPFDEFTENGEAADEEVSIAVLLPDEVNIDIELVDVLNAKENQDDEDDYIIIDDTKEEDAESMNMQPPAMGYFGFGGTF